MPRQSARILRRGARSRIAALTRRARLTTSLLVAISGGALATAGSRATWFVVRDRSAAVSVPGQGTFRFPADAVHLSGSDLTGGVIGVALLLLVCAALAFLAGPRVRAILLVALVAGSGLLIWWSAGLDRSDAIRAARETKHFSTAAPEIQPRAGRALTMAGAALAGIGGIAGVSVASGVGRVRMPERGPEET